MKKLIALVMFTVLLFSLTACVVKNEPATAVNNNTGTASESTAKTNSDENTSSPALSGVLANTMDKAKSLDNCYYELVIESNGTQRGITKVWVKDGKTKIQSDDSDIVNYIDLKEGKFLDYDNKTKKANIVPPVENYIKDFKRYAGAYLANADYDLVLNSLENSDKEEVEGISCAVGSYEDSEAKAKLYISEQYGIVMKFDFSTGNNKSLTYIKNLKVGSVTDQDVELPKDAKIIENK